MKELTIEQKTKAYDKVLERARKELQACGSSDCDAARQIFRLFPELQESEDDRIRKAIISIVAFSPEAIFNRVSVSREETLAWLEKQAEQKPVGFNIGDEITVNGQVCRVVAVDNTAWSEGDEAVLDALIQRLEGEDIHVSPHLAVKCLKSLKDRVQPKEKWSEEDEVTLDFLVDYLLDTIKKMPAEEYAGGLGKAVVLLKSLKDRVMLQPQQEWSEEDYNFIKELCDLLASISKDGYVGKYYTVDLVERLKSLRPKNRWKPSERQIYLLNWVANILLKDSGIVEKETAKELQQLLEQLKKL